MRTMSLLIALLLPAFLWNCEGNGSSPKTVREETTTPEQARAELKEMNIEFSEYAFLFKIRDGNVRAVKLFLQAGMSPDTRDTKRILGSSEQTAFQYTMSYGQPEMFLAMLEAGADVNARDVSGRTPLMNAAMRADPNLTAILVQKGAEVNSTLGAGWTPLLFAVTGENIDPSRALTGLLLDAVAGLQAELYGNGNRMKDKKPEARAETQDVIRTVQILLLAGADVNHKMAHGDTALMFAAMLGRPTITTMLLEAGADPDIANLSGETALDIARKFQRLDVVEVLDNGK